MNPVIHSLALLVRIHLEKAIESVAPQGIRHLEGHSVSVNVGELLNSIPFQYADLTLFGAHFVSASMRHLPSHLRARQKQESWLALFRAAATGMAAGFPPAVAAQVAAAASSSSATHHVSDFTSRK